MDTTFWLWFGIGTLCQVLFYRVWLARRARPENGTTSARAPSAPGYRDPALVETEALRERDSAVRAKNFWRLTACAFAALCAFACVVVYRVVAGQEELRDAYRQAVREAERDSRLLHCLADSRLCLADLASDESSK